MTLKISALAIRRVSVACAIVVVAVSVLVLAGHALGVSRLRAGLIGDTEVRPNAALAMLCVGAAILVRRRLFAGLLGAMAALLGAATGIEWLAGVDLRIDNLAFAGPETSMRMSIPAAAAVFSGGTAILFRERRTVTQFLAATTALIAILGLVARLFDRSPISGAATAPVAVSTAVMLMVWTLGYLLTVSDRGPFAIFLGDDQWATYARRIAAATLLMPVILGALSFASSRAGREDAPFFVALIVTTTTFTLLIAAVHLASRTRRTEAVYRTVVESAHDGICLVDGEQRVQIANARLAAMLGWSRDELIGRHIRELIDERDLPRVLEQDAARRAGGEPTQAEIRIRRRDGSVVPVISATSSVDAPDGFDGGTVVILTDISGRIAAEEALRRSETRFRRLYEANVIGLAFWGFDGVVQEANDELLRIFGVSRDVLPGWRWSEHNTPEGDLADAQAMAEIRATGRCAAYEKECIRRDGTRTWVQIAAAQLDETRNIAFVSDVTERVEVRRTLERAHEILAERVATLEGIETADLQRERAQVEELAARLAAATEELETFSYSVSHDLRAPLRAIDGFSRELLLGADSLDDTGRRYLTRIRAATQRMSHLIDDLLDLARLSRRPMKLERVDVSALAAEVAGELGAAHVAVQPGLTASADPHLLRVVLQNLIGNAVKFSAQRPDPKVEVFAAGDGAIAVRDNGVGFAMQYADKIFHPFQRLHAPTEFEGTGIGLALVQRIIRRHGGTIRAESAPGQGATFFFTLGDQRP